MFKAGDSLVNKTEPFLLGSGLCSFTQIWQFGFGICAAVEVSLPSLKAYLPAVPGIGAAKVKLDMAPPLTALWRKQIMYAVSG